MKPTRSSLNPSVFLMTAGLSLIVFAITTLGAVFIFTRESQPQVVESALLALAVILILVFMTISLGIGWFAARRFRR